jgi:hypothetical protein
MSSSTGAFHAAIAARTWPRASAAAAGPGASRTRHACNSAARLDTIVCVGFSEPDLEQPRRGRNPLRGRSPRLRRVLRAAAPGIGLEGH